MKRRVALAALVVAIVGAFAAPVWAATRSTARAAATGEPVAGYGLTARSTAIRYALASPGLLPVGDASKGDIFEVDVPIARTNVTGGPVIGVIASPLYPGDTASHLGTAIATFSPQAPAIPNYPIVAEANYPPAPGFGQDAAFAAPAVPGVGAGSSASHAGPEGATADSQVNSVAMPVDAPLVSVASARTTNDVDLKEDSVVSTAEAHIGAINIGGVITIDGINAIATTSSDGKTPKPGAALEIGKVSVAGQPAFIDADGIHLVGQQPVGSGVAPGVEALLQKTLKTDGLSIRAISPKTSTENGVASADTGGVLITIERTIPAVGVPGLAVPNVPPGTPDIPLHIEITLGGAQTTATATVVGADVEAASTGTDLPGADVQGDQFAADIAPVGPGASATGALGQPTSTAGSLQPVAATGNPLPRGTPIPIAWVLAGVALSIALMGPLMGYARWQLLEGRTR